MSKIETLKSSNVWDHRYNLPLVPIHNNPHLYCAYASLICKYHFDVESHIKRCRAKDGLIYRWPNQWGGTLSHDEILGLCFTSPNTVEEIYYHLIENNYDYGHNVRLDRFPHLISMMKVAIGMKLTLLDQLSLALYFIVDCFMKKDRHESSRLRRWLMSNILIEAPYLVAQAVELWRYIMNKRGITPKYLFSRYLVECPWFLENAPLKM
ncbi:MAG: hypothetical protein ABIM30_02775 [candidate division WOR-3 bacterium]